VQAISGEKRQPYRIDETACIRCGLCISSCRFGAIITVSEGKGMPAAAGTASNAGTSGTINATGGNACTTTTSGERE
jgi:Fe-S-cluster-containing hydrogenase component 2